MARYKASTLQLRKGKWYVSVTKPKELTFGKDAQARRSTGTTDKQQAQQLQHDLTQAIYDDFDRQLKRTDKAFEAVRPLLEQEGINTKQWYSAGQLEATVETLRLMGFDLSIDDGSMANATVQIKDHASLYKFLSRLGHSIPLEALGYLPLEDREMLQAPPQIPARDMMQLAIEGEPRLVCRRLIDLSYAAMSDLSRAA